MYRNLLKFILSRGTKVRLLTLLLYATYSYSADSRQKKHVDCT